MLVIAVDPGNIESAFAVYDADKDIPLDTGKIPNEELLRTVRRLLRAHPDAKYVIEMIQSYGMAVGRSVFDTCVFIGRLISLRPRSARLITRVSVKNHICNSAKATDANIRQALMDRWGSTRELAIGTKKTPGPLYHYQNTDTRAALALAITAAETEEEYIL